MNGLVKKVRGALSSLVHGCAQGIERWRSRNTETGDVRSVCLALGPYRNLTTLTSSILALHPRCQVLNHAGGRIYADPHLNFFADYEERKFESFVRFAIHASGSGEQGDRGGSIVHSHAFHPKHRIGQLYRERYGDRLVKEEIHCLFWKESLRTANVIRKENVDLDSLFAGNSALRFLMPVRNPMDCAVSNMKSGHVPIFEKLDRGATVEQVLEAILDELAWFLTLRKRFPDRFMCYFENAFDRDTLHGIADFLDIERDEEWCEASLEAYDLKPSYDHSAEFRALYKELLNARFGDYPDEMDLLVRFA